MTTYQWNDLRAKAANLYGGDTPQPALEQRILQVFATNPALVAQSINTIAARYQAGLIRSPWAVLAVHLEQATQPTENITRTDNVDRAKRIARAEQWIRAAGIHYDEPIEVADELFGERGQLRAYAQIDVHHQGRPNEHDQPTWQQKKITGDTQLIDRMLTYWAEHRPTGLQIERDSIARAEAWKGTR